MNIQPPFYLRSYATEGVKELLQKVTLGTNGARYRHLDTLVRLKDLENPLYLSLEPKDKVLANVTLCRRQVGWYIRYFAFEPSLQSEGNTRRKQSDGLLKQELSRFFQDAFNQKNAPDLMYAYIDPRNERSLWMSSNFGFKTKAKISTQTFSRIRPKEVKNVIEITEDLAWLKEKINETFKNHSLFFTKHTFNDTPFYGYYEDGVCKAFLKTHRANWVVERLPGRSGRVLTQIIPYVPGLRKIVRPSEFSFTAIEAVYLEKGASIEYLNRLFEGVLFHEKTNSIIWWVDQKDPLYHKVANKLNWGLLHKLNGANEVDLVVLERHNDRPQGLKQPYYTTAFDFI